MRFLEDEKLPTDVVRKEYSQSRHALCCLNCGFESEFAPHVPDSIGKPLYVRMAHDCPAQELQIDVLDQRRSLVWLMQLNPI